MCLDKGGAEKAFKGFGGSSRNNHNRSESPARGGKSQRPAAEENNSSNNSGDVEVIITRVTRTTEYYTILGVPRCAGSLALLWQPRVRSASEDEVKRAYKKVREQAGVTKTHRIARSEVAP